MYSYASGKFKYNGFILLSPDGRWDAWLMENLSVPINTLFILKYVFILFYKKYFNIVMLN
jgi:hypothetical protein